MEETKTNYEVAYELTEREYATLRTRSERRRQGHSAFPEFNVGVWFDSRNPKWAQPSHPIWKGNNQWGMRAPVLEAFMKQRNMI